jgi:hypothetical protein
VSRDHASADCLYLRAVELNTDHAFAGKRVALAREVLGGWRRNDFYKLITAIVEPMSGR